VEIQSLESSIDVVVTDLIMADMSGVELVNSLRATRPQVRALYITGYAHAPDGSSHFERLGPLLEKPFRLEQLARHVRRVLDQPPED
jgi:DNA-binding NtrC family response regulator